MLYEGWKGTNQTPPWSKSIFPPPCECEFSRSEARIYSALISDLLCHRRGGYLRSEPAGPVSLWTVPYLALRSKFIGQTMEYLQFHRKKKPAPWASSVPSEAVWKSRLLFCDSPTVSGRDGLALQAGELGRKAMHGAQAQTRVRGFISPHVSTSSMYITFISAGISFSDRNDILFCIIFVFPHECTDNILNALF